MIVLMATTFTAAVGFVILAVVVGRLINTGTAITISVVKGPVVTRVDRELVDIDTILGPPGEESGAAAGTGMVLTSSGVVLTNNHVIEDASSVHATDLGNGRTYTARVIGYDEHRDIAVLQLEGASGLATVTLGNSALERVGARITTIGNAGGVGGTPAARSGIVIALDRAIPVADDLAESSENLSSLIEVHGDLQPGDSGGPMINAAGKVVGLDTAASTTYAFSSQTTGEGFAIEIDRVMPTAARIRAGHGSTMIHVGPTAYIGVDIGQPLKHAPPGAAIAGVNAGTPAARAGIAAHDAITELAGQPINSTSALTAALVAFHPGQRIRISWVNQSGISHSATITLATNPTAA